MKLNKFVFVDDTRVSNMKEEKACWKSLGCDAAKGGVKCDKERV